MSPLPKSKSDPGSRDSSPRADGRARALADHVAAGFPPDLALDLVLNELVVQAADATHASAAALALFRGDEMVCRASTGLHAPDLGVPLNTRDGLSGACVRTREPQMCADTESDPRVDSAISRRLNVRSMLMVPVFDEESTGDLPQLIGVLEIFSPLVNAFDQSARARLEDFARECDSIRRVALALPASPPPDLAALQAGAEEGIEGEIIGQESTISAPMGDVSVSGDIPPVPRARPPYEVWTLVLGTLAILAAAGFSFLIGSRIGWLGSAPETAAIAPQPAPSESLAPAPTHAPAATPARAKPAAPAPSNPDELVVYEKGKVIFRMKPLAPAASDASKSRAQGQGQSPGPAPGDAPISNAEPAGDLAQASSTVVPASSTVRIASPKSVWLAPAQAESRLLTRIEPQYPADALAARRTGNVVLEVHVAGDGSVSAVRALSGDPTLAGAAADAVRNWHYQPYRANGQPAPFQTDVTVTFSLPD